MESYSEVRKTNEMLSIALKGNELGFNKLKSYLYSLCFIIGINWNCHADATFQASYAALPIKPKHFIVNIKKNKKAN